MTQTDLVSRNDEYFALAYEELRRVARKRGVGRQNPTWNATAVVNEVYIRLAEARSFEPTSPEHLKHTVIRAMRFVLVEAARRKAAERRGGGSVPLRRVHADDNSMHTAVADPEEIIHLSLALDALAQYDEFQARVFEYQFFGGLQVSEIAIVSGFSEKKVQRSLRLARAFLSLTLSGGRIG